MVSHDSFQSLSRRVVSPKKMKNPLLPPSFTSLPEEIVLNCLARIPRSRYPRLSLVSKTFRSFLSSPELYAVRSQLGNTEKSLYLCLWDRKSSRPPKWYTLWVNPNQTLIPIPSSSMPSVSKFTILVGSEIYVIDNGYTEPSCDVRVLDCRSNTWRDAPSMNVARKDAALCAYDGKIYVMGGVKEEESSFGEVFDIKTQTWECLPDPCSEVHNCFFCKIVEIEGKIIFGNTFKMCAYDTKQGKWECHDGLLATTTFPGSAIVVENVCYHFFFASGRCRCNCYDIEDGQLKEVKWLESLDEKCKRSGGAAMRLLQIVNFGGKLVTIWEEPIKKRNFRFWNHFHKKKKIWCAEISLEKREGGEIWGNVEWFDVVHTVPRSCQLIHCLGVSV